MNKEGINNQEEFNKVYKDIFFEMMRLGKSYNNIEIYKTKNLGIISNNLN